MLNRRGKTCKKVCIGIILIVACFIIGYNIHENMHVHFEDENMGILICDTIGNGVTVDNVRYKDLKEVEELYVGHVGYYETLEDIEKCKKLQTLFINEMSMEYDSAYKINEGQVGKILSTEEVEKIQEELNKILPRLRNLKEFSFTNAANNCNIQNIDFLEKCKSVEKISVVYCNIDDYSILANCPQLKEIDLDGSQIETADDLLKLEGIEKFSLKETPLSQNAEEVERLREAFPEVKIIIE